MLHRGAAAPGVQPKNKQMQKAMNYNNIEGAALGLLAGMTTFFLKIDSDFLMRIMESMIAALATGAAGAIGHYIVHRIVHTKKKQDEVHPK